MSAAGIPVVSRGRATVGSSAVSDEWFSMLPNVGPGSAPENQDFEWFLELCSHEREVHQHLTLVSPVAATGVDLVLIDILCDLLEGALRRPSKIVLAKLEGASMGSLSLAGDHESAFIGNGPADAWVLKTEEALRNPFRLLRRPALILNCGSTRVKVARNKAQIEPYVAAEMLARMLLLERQKLDAELSEVLLEKGLDRLLRGTQ
jgi:hypothetical protein